MERGNERKRERSEMDCEKRKKIKKTNNKTDAYQKITQNFVKDALRNKTKIVIELEKECNGVDKERERDGKK